MVYSSFYIKTESWKHWKHFTIKNTLTQHVNYYEWSSQKPEPIQTDELRYICRHLCYKLVQFLATKGFYVGHMKRVHSFLNKAFITDF